MYKRQASYSALELAAAEAVSQISSMFFVPLTGLIMMVTLLSSVSDNVNSAKIISLLKKIIDVYKRQVRRNNSGSKFRVLPVRCKSP